MEVTCELPANEISFSTIKVNYLSQDLGIVTLEIYLHTMVGVHKLKQMKNVSELNSFLSQSNEYRIFVLKLAQNGSFPKKAAEQRRTIKVWRIIDRINEYDEDIGEYVNDPAHIGQTQTIWIIHIRQARIWRRGMLYLGARTPCPNAEIALTLIKGT